MSTNKEKKITIADLYPDLTAEERIEAEENLRQYLSVVKRIFEHISVNDPKVLTKLRRRARLRRQKGA